MGCDPWSHANLAPMGTCTMCGTVGESRETRHTDAPLCGLPRGAHGCTLRQTRVQNAFLFLSPYYNRKRPSLQIPSEEPHGVVHGRIQQGSVRKLKVFASNLGLRSFPLRHRRDRATGLKTTKRPARERESHERDERERATRDAASVTLYQNVWRVLGAPPAGQKNFPRPAGEKRLGPGVSSPLSPITSQ